MHNSISQQIYEITKKIPKGKVATYGQIARLSGSPNAARLVGLLMKNNPDQITIPCHRVVGSDGRLCGYSAPGGIAKKKEILMKEGVIFIKDRVDLSSSRWIPKRS